MKGVFYWVTKQSVINTELQAKQYLSFDTHGGARTLPDHIAADYLFLSGVTSNSVWWQLHYSEKTL